MFDPNITSQLAFSVPVLLVVFGYLYLREKKLQQAEESRDKRHLELVEMQQAAAKIVADEHSRATDRIAATFDRIIERHEGIEVQQSQNLRDGHREMSTALRELTKQLGRGDEVFRTLAQEHTEHPIMRQTDQPEYHIGLPPGHEEPDEILSRTRIAGEVRPWTWSEFGIDALCEAGIRGRGATVVVIDTGTDLGHSDLAPNTNAAASRSFTGEPLHDGNGHGTHCCGIVAADDNGTGVQGVAPDAKLVAMKGLSNQGSGYGSWLANAIRAAADLPGHKILSMSFGAGGEDPVISAAIRDAYAKGCWLVAAAGNDGPGSINWPGALDEVVCVASTDKGGRVSGFSSANEFVDVGFGGRDILSTYPGNRLATMSGTSMATPGVAGVLALAVGELIKAGRPIPHQSKMCEILYATCTAPDQRNNYTGYGLVRPAKFIAAMLAAGGAVNPPPVNPDPDRKPISRIAVPEGARFVEFYA